MSKSGLQIGHFEENSRRKKLKTQGKNSITQGLNSSFRQLLHNCQKHKDNLNCERVRNRGVKASLLVCIQMLIKRFHFGTEILGYELIIQLNNAKLKEKTQGFGKTKN